MDVLCRASPTLTEAVALDKIATQVKLAGDALYDFIPTGNTHLIDVAKSDLNIAVRYSRELPLLPLGDKYDYSSAVSGFQHALTAAYESINGKSTDLELRLDKVGEDLSAKNQALSGLESVIEQRKIEISAALEQIGTDFEAVKKGLEDSFRSEIDTFRVDFASIRKSHEESVLGDQERFAKYYENQKIFFEDNANNIIRTLEDKLMEAKKLVDIVGNVGVTGNYQKIANDHRRSANIFRRLALVFLVVMSGLLAWSVIEMSKNNFDLYKALARILAAAILTYPSVYCSRESSRHRNLETQNRQMELQLASIGPFIELFDERDKVDTKKMLVEKYFGAAILTGDDKKTENDSFSLEAIERLVKIILSVIKSNK